MGSTTWIHGFIAFNVKRPDAVCPTVDPSVDRLTAEVIEKKIVVIPQRTILSDTSNSERFSVFDWPAGPTYSPIHTACATLEERLFHVL